MTRPRMARSSWSSAIALGVAALAGVATAQPAATFDRLEQALPPGWSLLATGAELVIRHDRPCYVTGTRHPDAAAVEHRSEGGGPLVTIELRYRLEPRWSDQQLAAARAVNDKLGGELRALAARFHIDAIHKVKGRPVPASADERARLEAYDAAHAELAQRQVKLPRCSVGEVSVFDGDDTYAQLALEVDPPEVMVQAHRIVELMKQHCG